MLVLLLRCVVVIVGINELVDFGVKSGRTKQLVAMDSGKRQSNVDLMATQVMVSDSISISILLVFEVDRNLERNVDYRKI